MHNFFRTDYTIYWYARQALKLNLNSYIVLLHGDPKY